LGKGRSAEGSFSGTPAGTKTTEKKFHQNRRVFSTVPSI